MIPEFWLIALIIILAIWDAVWKGIGMWKASKNDQLTWFVVIFIFNTLGILPLVYLKFFQKKATTPAKKKKSTKK